MYYTINYILHSAQALAEIHAENPPAHPRQLNKIIGDRLAKRIFVTKNALCRHLRPAKSTCESRFGRNWVTFWTRLAVVWLQKVSKTAGQTPKINQKCVKWGHFGPFGGHFYPLWIDSQRNKK